MLNFFFSKKMKYFHIGEDNKINMEELIHLKNKINIVPKATKKKKKEKDGKETPGKEIEINTKIEEEKKVEKEEKNDLLKVKSEKLLSFKNLITNMEIIYENMQILRSKGNNLR